MVRPILDDQPALRQRLLHVMAEIDYPYQAHHEDIIDNAIVFECSEDGQIAAISGFTGYWGVSISGPYTCWF